jgi:hypothetical protein
MKENGTHDCAMAQAGSSHFTSQRLDQMRRESLRVQILTRSLWMAGKSFARRCYAIVVPCRDVPHS